MEDNTPYGFEDLGLKTKPKSKANSTDLKDKNFREQFKDFPQTIKESDIALYEISLMKKSINYEQ